MRIRHAEQRAAIRMSFRARRGGTYRSFDGDPENVWISRNPLEISSDSRLVWSARSLGVSDRRAQAGMADGSNLAVPVTRRLSLAWHQWRVAENSRSFPTFAFSRCADWRRHDGE